MPKLLYIAPRDFPRRVANRVQTIKMAEAFSQYAEVTLVVSKLQLLSQVGGLNLQALKTP